MAKDDENKLLDEDSKKLWKYVIRHDTKIKHKRYVDGGVPDDKHLTKTYGKSDSSNIKSCAHNAEICVMPDINYGQAFQVDRSTAKNLRDGKMPIDDRLDLHGYTIEKAYYRFRDFIFSSYDDKKRCVLIITGKGTHSNSSNLCTIRENFPRWINLTGIREKVLMFSYAKTKDGGEGAVYVLIKKNRL